MMIRIRKVEPLDHFRVRIELTNGKQKTIDLEPFLHGPIFEPLRRDVTLFQSVKVDKELGTIVWDNGADIDPDVLIGKQRPDIPEKRRLKKFTPTVPKALVVKESRASYRMKKKKK